MVSGNPCYPRVDRVAKTRISIFSPSIQRSFKISLLLSFGRPSENLQRNIVSLF
jgi:hypothetical protein